MCLTGRLTDFNDTLGDRSLKEVLSIDPVSGKNVSQCLWGKNMKRGREKNRENIREKGIKGEGKAKWEEKD